MLVLDEPTSALDGRAEEAISDVLASLRGRTTLVIIAHRLSTLESCDRVLLVADRKVVELGDGRSVAGHRAAVDFLGSDTNSPGGFGS